MNIYLWGGGKDSSRYCDTRYPLINILLSAVDTVLALFSSLCC